MNDYFELTENGFIIKDDTIFLVESYNEVYKRDPSQDKAMAYKELHFIFQCGNIKSTSRKKGLKGNKLHADAKKAARLPETWTADIEVEACIEYWIADRSDVVIQSYSNILETLATANEAVELLGGLLRNTIAKMKENEEDTISSDSIRVVTSSVAELLKMSTDIPKKIQDLDGIKDRALSSNKTSSKGRGGIELTDGMSTVNNVTQRNKGNE